MYLSFLLLIAIIYNRFTLLLFRIKQLAMNLSENQTETHLYIQCLTASLGNTAYTHCSV